MTTEPTTTPLELHLASLDQIMADDPGLKQINIELEEARLIWNERKKKCDEERKVITQEIRALQGKVRELNNQIAHKIKRKNGIDYIHVKPRALDGLERRYHTRKRNIKMQYVKAQTVNTRNELMRDIKLRYDTYVAKKMPPLTQEQIAAMQKPPTEKPKEDNYVHNDKG